MRKKIVAFDQDFDYMMQNNVKIEMEDAEPTTALAALDELVDSIGFTCLSKRNSVWEQNEYLKVMDESGRYVSVYTHLGTIPQDSIYVSYDIKGMKDDVEQVKMLMGKYSGDKNGS